MPTYDYRVLPAPRRGVKARGAKGEEARFAAAVEAEMNRMGAQGWDYVRSDTLPSEERQGWFGGRATVFRTLLVFRRARAEAAAGAVAMPPVAALPRPSAQEASGQEVAARQASAPWPLAATPPRPGGEPPEPEPDPQPGDPLPGEPRPGPLAPVAASHASSLATRGPSVDAAASVERLAAAMAARPAPAVVAPAVAVAPPLAAPRRVGPGGMAPEGAPPARREPRLVGE